MAAAIQSKFGITSELIESKGGIFDVRVDDKLVYSKSDTGRFPENDEIFQQLASAGK